MYLCVYCFSSNSLTLTRFRLLCFGLNNVCVLYTILTAPLHVLVIKKCWKWNTPTQRVSREPLRRIPMMLSWTLPQCFMPLHSTGIKHQLLIYVNSSHSHHFSGHTTSCCIYIYTFLIFFLFNITKKKIYH
jgi:hypothetical protein